MFTGEESECDMFVFPMAYPLPYVVLSVSQAVAGTKEKRRFPACEWDRHSGLDSRLSTPSASSVEARITHLHVSRSPPPLRPSERMRLCDACVHDREGASECKRSSILS